MKYPLAFYEEYSQNTKIRHLFREILRIQSATWETYVDELKLMQSKSQVSFDNIYGIYKEIPPVTLTEQQWIHVWLELTSIVR